MDQARSVEDREVFASKTTTPLTEVWLRQGHSSRCAAERVRQSQQGRYILREDLLQLAVSPLLGYAGRGGPLFIAEPQGLAASRLRQQEHGDAPETAPGREVQQRLVRGRICDRGKREAQASKVRLERLLPNMLSHMLKHTNTHTNVLTNTAKPNTKGHKHTHLCLYASPQKPSRQ